MLDIVHLITTIDRGGAESQLLILSREQVRNGNKVRVLYLKGNAELRSEFLNAGIQNVDFLMNKPILFQIYFLRKYLKKYTNKKTIIHAHLPRMQVILAFTGFNSDNVFATRHDAERFYAKAPKLISKILSKITSRKLRKWVAISESVRDSMVHDRELFKHSSITVIPYGYEITHKKILPEKDTNNLIFGTVARLVHQKNLFTLVRGFSKYSELNPNSKLHIVGGGPLDLDIKRLIFQLKMENKITMHGHVQDVHRVLETFDVFVLASTSEGFGLVMLEAMAHSLPIISSDIKTLKEVVGVENGLFFDATSHFELAQKMNDMNSIETRMKLAEKSFIRLQQFDIRKTEKLHENLYTLSQ